MLSHPPSAGVDRRGTSLRSLVFAFAILTLGSPGPADVARAEEPPAESESTESESTESESTDSQSSAPTFLEAVTVTATLTPRELRDTAGSVSVIDAEEIEELGMTDASDLVKYQPGVYVANDVARLGLGGFNIRGIGENRVLTRIDGVPVAEQFDFGPLAVTSFVADLDTLESVEIVRSAGSSLYGSDALGGVVSLVTRDPSSYLAEGNPYWGLRAGYHGRDHQLSESVTFAAGGDRWQGSVVATRRDGEELDNQGTVTTMDASRTAPNPRDRESLDLLGKVVYRPGERSTFELATEWLDAETETEVLNGQGFDAFGTLVEDFDAVDRQDRLRLGLEHNFQAGYRAFDTAFWRLYTQESSTEQRTGELRAGGLGRSQRLGLLTFEQDTVGGEVQLQKYLDAGWTHLVSYGVAVQRDRFDQLRDRSESLVESGTPVPSFLTFPTKYFPRSTVTEVGLYLQDEIELPGGRLRLIPGLRYDSYDLDADQDDAVYLSGNAGIEPPVDVTEDAVAPRLGVVFAASSRVSLFGQYSRGFRAPPYSSINNGFTNFAGGYTTLPNPDLEPETSDNLELGIRGSFARGSFSVTIFDNRYDDFIDIVALPFDPQVGLLEFQPRNVDDASISGVEVTGELRLGRRWSARGSFADVEGDDETDDQPLLSIPPSRLVVGLRYRASDHRWGGELTATFVDAKDVSEIPESSDQFPAPSYQVVDLTTFYDFTSGFSVQAGLYNLLDESYWPWPNVRGIPAGASNLDFYTAPGRSFGINLRYHF